MRIISLVNAAYGLLLRRNARVSVGIGSKVRWWGIHVRQGGRIRIGKESIVNCRIDFDSPNGEVVIGERCYVGASHLVCYQRIALGDDVIISWGVTIVDHDSHAVQWEQRSHDVRDWMQGKKDWTAVRVDPVRIGDRVWIGFGASILRGVSIGQGAVVGARAVVTKDVPPNCVVAGNPAREVRAMHGEVMRDRSPDQHHDGSRDEG